MSTKHIRHLICVNISLSHLSIAGRYFDEISQDTGKYCFGVEDTLRALELGSVETLICWENLDIQRYVLKNHTNGEEKVLHLTPEQEKDKTHFTDKEVSCDSITQSFILLLFSALKSCQTSILPKPKLCENFVGLRKKRS